MSQCGVSDSGGCAGSVTLEEGAAAPLPAWVPNDVRAYLAHTFVGRSIRSVARDCGCQPSTISRRVRRIESRRDDLLVDLALNRLCASAYRREASGSTGDATAMTHHEQFSLPDEPTIEREAARVLRRLNEPGACMALAPAMDNAVVVRETADGGPAVRTAVVERVVAEAMALKGWIETTGSGRILRYRITASGRAALKRFVAQDESRRAAAVGTGPDERHPGYEDREIEENGRRVKVRYNLAESPLSALSRRRDKDGRPFLSDELVAAGERLREDFELAQIGPHVTQNWDALVQGRVDGGGGAEGGGSQAARDRLAMALAALGPGLGDVALRCCCFLEGLEAAEQRMGWSARSGKIVLRIALMQLKLHYDAHSDHWSPLIG